ncbi:uncharacterized protein [Elaeis guineensis]|uniref:Uncharacterized protein LOC105061398 n=1 Tax=Elaeis guineensis var. tenera TaxID=51953 RepID=A0A6I9SIJ3_ELAGV|nr:uncharacterized protein LOC105061398 [Elaeis guineensis]XP_010943723.1 uncharacterized protein LOC105061398 [Elaeis guineensis]XP_010943724.1 uncharacterized protein LOC105061398 [Elaeis guineensis]XP_019701631.1 uncharacterized protein LOC105061398 [Elaeis guineensis]XP_029116622.1 uncharacterized protein LOC105061398 [Elaeis guineensis]
MADPHPPEVPANGGGPAETLVPCLGSKRQRRPSVRLGEIGDQPAAIPYEPYIRRTKHWKLPSDHAKPRAYLSRDPFKHSSKTRPLTTLAPEGDALDGPPTSDDHVLLPVDENLDFHGAGIRRGSRDGKAWRGGGVRRARSSWIPKVDEGNEGPDLKSSSGEDAGDEGYRDNLESPSDRNDRRAAARVRVSESRDGGPWAEGDLPSETDNRDWNNRNGWWRSVGDGGVRSWLNGLGLGRYAPVFEIHEVDDDVLPLLTLEDLKDMGINAVGSRRKMYCAIQKLRKNVM